LRLLYQLKMATERLLLTSEAATAKPADAKTGGGVTKGIRVPREKFDNHERNFFEHRLRATGLNVKQARQDKVIRKFEEEKHVQERVAMEMDNIEMGRIGEQRDIHRFALRERMRLNRQAKDEWNRQSTEAWEQNMQVRYDREIGEMTFEDRKMQNHYGKKHTIRHSHATDVRDGVDMFETGLTTLGIKKAKRREYARACPRRVLRGR